MKMQEQAKEDYLQGLKYQEIADKYNVSLNTVKSWKTRYKWSKKVCTQNKKSVHTKTGAPKGNKNAVGHGAPAENQNATTHGLFAKYLPEETLDIIHGLEHKSPIDILWENICIKYAAILRAQKIMHVTDKDELIKHLKTESTTEHGGSETYEFQFAWDRQASFLNAQARAMGTLNSMIKQYDELCRSHMTTEEQRLRVEKLKQDISKNGEVEDQQGNIDQLLASLDKARQELDL